MASIISASTTSGTALNMSADTTGVLQLATGATPTTAVTIDASQNVGIGTSSPARQAVIYGSFPCLQLVNSTSGATSNDGLLIFESGLNATLSNQEAGYMSFETSNTERMRISPTGQVGFNTTLVSWGSPLSAIQVASTAFAANGTIAYVLGNAYYNGSNWKRISSGYGSRIDASADTGQITTSTTGFSTADSNITWTSGPFVANLGTSWTSSSDERLKNITGEISDAINKVSQLRAAEFTWKSDESNKPCVGLIAQDLQKVLPEVVVVPEKDEKEDGTKNYLGVNYTEVIPLLVAAIKEQQTIINDLKARVTALEAK